MNITGFLILLLVGAICGAFAQFIVGRSAGGLLVSIALGIVGSVFGTWLAHLIGLPSLLAVSIEGYRIEIIWSIVGEALILLIVSAVRRRSYLEP